jgi:FMN phosphatase YigB (HAD superfamily)
LPTYRYVFGARQLGMTTVLFRHDQGMPSPNETQPDYLIREFAELPRTVSFFTAL